MSLGDIATNALSGNPSAQMAQALAGPQPGAPGASEQRGAMNPSPAPAMAQPQATQSPPDLAKLYMQLYNQQRGAAMFDQGVSGMQAALAPPGQQAAWLAHGNQSGRQDPGAMLQNLMQMQYMQRLNEARPAMVQALTGDGSGGGATGGLPAAVVNALPPDQLMKLLDQRAQSGLQIAQQGTEMKQKELIEAQEKAPASLQQMSDMDSVADQLKGPLNPALTSLISNPAARIAAEKLLETDPAKEPWDSTKNLVYQNMLSSDQLAAVNQLKKLDAQIYGDAFQSTGSRRTQVEVANLKNGISTLMNFNQKPEDYMNQFNDFQKQLHKTMANTYGAAGRVDEIPDVMKWDMTDPKNPKPMVDTAYLPNGDKYGGKGGQWASQPPQQQGPAPTTIQSPGDIARLAKGTPFVIPDGPSKGKIGYAQ